LQICNAVNHFVNISTDQKVAANIDLSKPNMEEVVAFGGINYGSEMGLRSSDRLRAQPNSDATQMERAMMISQKLDEPQKFGTPKPSRLSFMSFTNKQTVDTAARIGISMGDTREQKIEAPKLLKYIEEHRSLIFLNNSELQKSNEDIPHCLAVARASVLCEDLEEHEGLVNHNHVEDLLPKIKNKKKNEKRSYDKT
jgi:hypothetical protein